MVFGYQSTVSAKVVPGESGVQASIELSDLSI